MTSNERISLYLEALQACLPRGCAGRAVSPVSDLVFQSGQKATLGKEVDCSQLLSSINAVLKRNCADEVKAESLLGLLSARAVDIAAEGQPFPDVTLYDYARLSAAKAICQHDYQEAGSAAACPFLLVGGDVSGIQSYIYAISSKKAARSLKGRSFYIRLLSDAIVRTVLKRLHLFRANIIYNSGGSFYLLAPNTVFVQTELAAVCRDLDGMLFQSHGNLLYVAVDSVELSDASLSHQPDAQTLPEVWKSLFTKRDHKKRSRFSAVMKENPSAFFQPQPYDEGAKQDDRFTAQQQELGRALHHTAAILVSETKEGLPADAVSIEPIGLGLHYTMLSDKHLSQSSLFPAGSTLIHLNANQPEPILDDLLIHEYEFYGGNRNTQKTFDELCTGDDDNLRRLGVLRMDVDNLGYIFQQGLTPEQASLERYSCLSRSFDRFFSGHLNDIQQEVAPDSAIIIYSGGDDVFVVGSWEKTIEMAKRIRSDFKYYTKGNSAFSISGGIALIEGKYPIMRGAADSDEEEKNAKNHALTLSNSEQRLKDSLSFMETPLNWQEEFPVVESLKDAIVSFVNSKAVPKSFIGKILRHAATAGISNHRIKNFKTYWMLTYDISRQMKEFKDPAAQEMAKCLIKEVCGKSSTLNGQPIHTDYHPLELWAFAARWAELYIRTTK